MADARWDVIVVGAGPAGSATAIAAARAGCRTLLLDRADFPRDKPCGDLIGARAMALARRLGVAEADLAPYRPLRGAYLAADGGAVDLTPRTALGRVLLAHSDARVIPRAVFDAALVRAAQRAGADLRRVNVRQVSAWDGDGRTVRGEQAAGPVDFAARVVVNAGGYGCRVGGEPGAAPRRSDQPPRGIAMRGYFAGVAAPPGRIAFCLNAWVLPGYGWVFPLPEGGANVGVGTLTAGGASEHLRELYARFVSDPASPVAAWLGAAVPVAPPRSWPLDLGPRRRRLVADGLLVAGEAASLVGPLTGAGIAFALDSGARAGAVAARALGTGEAHAARLAPYRHYVSRHCLPWQRTEGLAQRWLSDPDRLGRLLHVVRPLPPTAALGARLLLHLG